MSLMLLGVVYGLIIYRVQSLEMDIRSAPWVIEAVPAALSDVVFGHRVRYTTLTIVDGAYWEGLKTTARTADDIDAVMAQIEALDRSRIGSEYKLLGSDDKGIVDFVALAFRLFGLHFRGITWLYFLLQGGSCLLLVVGSRRHPAIIGLLVVLLLGQYMLLPMIRFNPQLGSLLALRAMPVLSLVACLHAIYFALQPSTRPIDIILVLAQVGLIVYAVHIRSTTEWQVGILTLATIVAMLLRWCREHTETGRVTWRQLRSSAIVGLPLAAALLGLLFLRGYRVVAYPAEYQRGDQILIRVFWHNIVSGLSFQPDFAEREQMRIDDVSVVYAIGRYLIQNGRRDEWVAMGGESPALADIRWAMYDRVARDYLVDECRAEPSVCLSADFYYKPRSLLGLMAWLYGIRDFPPDIEIFVSRHWGDAVLKQTIDFNEQLTKAGLRGGLFAPPILAVIAALVLCRVLLKPRNLGIIWLVGAALFVGSLVPILVGYPSTWTITENAIVVTALMYLAMLECTVLVLTYIWHRFRHASKRSGLPHSLPARD
jgi:hypothetical protein